MLDVCFVKTGKAYIPEASAYSQYLKSKGFDTVVVEGNDNARLVDAKLYYRFGGVLKGNIRSGVPEIHEYHTASTGQFPRLKNLVKSALGSTPCYYSFLSPFVENQYWFNAKIPRFYRDMGAPSELLAIRNSKEAAVYDICYFGSISQRKGVRESIVKLASLGLSIVVAGKADEVDAAILEKTEGVKFLGTVQREEVDSYLSCSKAGLNFMPDEYPLTSQTSTKVIEYLVAGVPVISNDYSWIIEHSELHGYKFANIDGLTKENFQALLSDERTILPVDEVKKFTWDNILERIHFDRLILSCINS
ncbi:glycosyltransferase [Vibrio sp. 10N]|uniref:glycosyltransferase n=1 Tax=Vibrio sp. 10N TaxID=3058938 RepID=UPI0028142C22|nr:hypothetical protein VB10N_28630 [Vibrio sp. 10N]